MFGNRTEFYHYGECDTDRKFQLGQSNHLFSRSLEYGEHYLTYEWCGDYMVSSECPRGSYGLESKQWGFYNTSVYFGKQFIHSTNGTTERFRYHPRQRGMSGRGNGLHHYRQSNPCRHTPCESSSVS